MSRNADALSRPLACAAALGRHAAEAGRFVDKRVLLTGEADILATPNGRWMASDALRLLVRICRNVDVSMPSVTAQLQRELERLARAIEFGPPVRFLDESPDLVAYDAILSIGSKVPARSGTVIRADGWLARVSSVEDIPGNYRADNPIACLAAASLGVSEVFKRLVGIRPERGPYFDRLSFSLFTLDLGEDDGPSLQAMQLPTTLVAGQGALGNGIVLLLSQVDLRGNVVLLDRQAYGPENLGTCVVLGPDGIDRPKAEHNAHWLATNSSLSVKPARGDLETLLMSFGKQLPRPSIVLGGLDNVQARHLLQELWPDLLVDGAIGDFSCQAAAYEWDRGMACLKCLFDLPRGPDPEHAASAETGLTPARIRDAEALVTMTDVETAPESRRDLLRASVGRKICSVVSDAMRAKISRDERSASFSPSVPFVATMSASLVMAMLVRRLMGQPFDPARYYMDILMGPETAERFNEHPRATCYCVQRRAMITTFREAFA